MTACRVLVATEKSTNVITTYRVDASGLASAPIVNASAGSTPFGFAFGKRGQLLVSEAFGGAPDASAASSYVLSPDGTLSLAVTHTANAGSGPISGLLTFMKFG